ncbi:MAG: choline kinase family protein [Bacilli bacterium]|jgi:thiamine kinase-like enzyme
MKQARTLYYQITGLEAHTIVPIHGGLNSVNYLINGEFVLRCKNPTVDTRYDPQNEYLAERLVAPTGLVPKLLHFDQDSGDKLTAFMPKTAFLSRPPTIDEVKLVAAALRTLHGLKPDGLSPFDPLARYEIYKAASQIETPSHNEKKIVEYVVERLGHDPLVFAHNDLVRGNILFKDDRVFIIDFEYAGINHPLFDLASFITENNIDDPTLIKVFLTAYYQEKNIPWRDFEVFCRFLDYLWYYWAQGMFVTTGQSIFKTIARLKWSRIKKY